MNQHKLDQIEAIGNKELLELSPVETFVLSGDLASRKRARELRVSILESLDELQSVTLDLSRVDSMSPGFTHELFGLIVAQKGFSYFINRCSILSNEKLKAQIAKQLVEYLLG